MKLKIVLGTMNPSKLEEMKTYFDGMDVSPQAPSEITRTRPTITENADSVRGNAVLKAQAWHRISGLPVIAEDSGLVFLDLPRNHPDQPGQFVRRFEGRSMTDEEMLKHYTDLIHRHGGELRACWENCWCLLLDEKHGEVHENVSATYLLRETASPHRNPGWPLDSISWLPEVGKYLVDCTDEDIAYRDRKGGYRDTFHDWLSAAVERLQQGSLSLLQ